MSIEPQSKIRPYYWSTFIIHADIASITSIQNIDSVPVWSTGHDINGYYPVQYGVLLNRYSCTQTMTFPAFGGNHTGFQGGEYRPGDRPNSRILLLILVSRTF